MAAAASDITVEVSGPTNPTTPTTRTFKATVSYVTEAGAREVATGTRIQQNQDVPPQTLAETRSIVATTTVDTIAHGNYDGEGNSLSRERLEELGVTPGATLEFEGATFTWPDVEAGRPDAVASRGQLIALEGSGAQLAVLGSGLGRGGASGEFAINYTDGTTSTGTIGFGNWFSATPSFDEKVAYATDGRNTPAGYANANIKYGIYVATIDLDPGKTVESVLLPQSASLRIFDMTIADAAVEPTPDPTDKPDPTQKPDPTEKPTATKSPRPEFQRTAPYTLAGTHDLNGCRSYTMTTVYSATLPRASHPCRLLTEGFGTDFGIKAFS